VSALASNARKVVHYIRESKFKGITLDFADSLITATASINNPTLLTLNADHYPMGDVPLHQEAENS
jgi:predicted nucleic acid-binding protein